MALACSAPLPVLSSSRRLLDDGLPTYYAVFVKDGEMQHSEEMTSQAAAHGVDRGPPVRFQPRGRLADMSDAGRASVAAAMCKRRAKACEDVMPTEDSETDVLDHRPRPLASSRPRRRLTLTLNGTSGSPISPPATNRMTFAIGLHLTASRLQVTWPSHSSISPLPIWPP